MVVFNTRLAGNRRWISHVSGGARLNVIKVGNHLLQIYNSLLIAFLTLNLTMTNYCVSESFYRPLTLPIFPVPPSNLFQRNAATGPNVSHLTRLAANLVCQYVSSLIHQLSLLISAVLLLSPPRGLTLPLAWVVQFHPQVICLKVLKQWQSQSLLRRKCSEGKQRRGWG